MKTFYMAIGLAALLASGSANAAIVYDTITGLTAVNQLKLLPIQRHAPMGDVFHAATAETIASVEVQLMGMNGSVKAGGFQNDTGSVLLYLVPSVAGLPSHTGTALTNSIFLGSILDSTMLGNNTINNLTLQTSASISAGDWWLMLASASDPINFHGVRNPVDTAAAWDVVTTATAAGAPGLTTSSGGFFTAGTNTGNTNIVGGIATSGDFLNNQTFMAEIKTPEPTSLALLGAGLLGLGLSNRRRSRTSK